MFSELARDEVFRLETRRLWLRWPRAADAAALVDRAGDRDVARMTAALPHPYAREHAEQFIRTSREDNVRGTALRLALTLKSGARDLVGMIGVEECDGRPMLGYWLGKPFWRQGLMSEAAAAIVDAFFLVTEAEELGALVLPDNGGSIGVLERLGFVDVERPADGQGRHAKNLSLRLALRRRDWQARADGLRAGLASDRALL